LKEEAGTPADQAPAVRRVDPIDGVCTDVDMASARGAKRDGVRPCPRHERIARDDAVFKDRETDWPRVPIGCERVPRDDHIPVADQIVAGQALAERRPRERVPQAGDGRVGVLEDIVRDGDVVPGEHECMCPGAAGPSILEVRPIGVTEPKTLHDVFAL
jgi:hypothetical protein